MAAFKDPNSESDSEDNDQGAEIETDCLQSEASLKVAENLSLVHLGNTKVGSDRRVISSVRHSGRHVSLTQTEETQCSSSSTEDEKTDGTHISESVKTQEAIAKSRQPAEDTTNLGRHNVTPQTQLERRVQPAAFVQNEDGDTYLHLTIIHERHDLAYQIIPQAPAAKDLDKLNHLCQSALHLAVHTDLSRVVRKLLVWGAIIDQCDRKGYTALHIACEKGYLGCVRALTYPITVEERAEIPPSYHVPPQQIPQDLTTVTYSSGSCLHLAAEHNHLDIIRHLVEYCGADINIQEHNAGYTILHKAIEKQYSSLVEYVLTVPTVNLDVQTWAGGTAWQLAIGRGFLQCASKLQQAGACKDPLPEDMDSDVV